MVDSMARAGKVQGESEISWSARKQGSIQKVMEACMSKGHGSQFEGVPNGHVYSNFNYKRNNASNVLLS